MYQLKSVNNLYTILYRRVNFEEELVLLSGANQHNFRFKRLVLKN